MKKQKVSKKQIKKELERYEKETEIRMRKLKQAATYGLFSSSEAVYEYKTVHTIKEALELGEEGWWWVTDQDLYFKNIALYCYRALKKLL